MTTKRVLLISYYFSPYPAVGAKRVSYWAEKLPEYGFDVGVITACKGDASDRYKRIEIKPAKIAWGRRFFIKDEGLNWVNPLINFFEKKELAFKYDVVLISGGPFMHFMIGRLIKKNNPSVKIILDYRDPFARNPRFRSSWLKIHLKLFFEKRMNRYADCILSVNNVCLSLISGNAEKKHVVENGYDERLVPENKAKGNGFIYAGKLYSDSNPQGFIEVLQELKVASLLIIGDNKSFFQSTDLLKYDSLTLEGSIPYQNVLERINNADVGLVFTGGEPFESTTKIYDYLALNKKVLIVTNGEPKTGTLYELTRNNPNVYWVKNQYDDLKRVIPQVLNEKTVPFDATRYSREASVKRLIQLF